MEKRDPTHVLVVEIPLDMAVPGPDFDAVGDTLKLVLSLSRAAYRGNICNDIQVNVRTPGKEETDGAERGRAFDWQAEDR